VRSTIPRSGSMQGVVDNYQKEYEEKESAYNKFIHENLGTSVVLEQLLRKRHRERHSGAVHQFRESDATLFLDLARDKPYSQL